MDRRNFLAANLFGYLLSWVPLTKAWAASRGLDGICILYQWSDENWTATEHLGRTVFVRSHWVKFRAPIEAGKLLAAYQIVGKVNESAFGGVKRGHLIAKGSKGERIDNETWVIEAEFQECSESYIEPPRFMDIETGRIIDCPKPLYGTAEFSGTVPLAGDFKRVELPQFVAMKDDGTPW